MQAYQEAIAKAALRQGEHLVLLCAMGQTKRALVRIAKEGKIEYLVQPDPDDMYCRWSRLVDSESVGIGKIFVWAGKDAEFMQRFEGPPVATIDLK